MMAPSEPQTDDPSSPGTMQQQEEDDDDEPTTLDDLRQMGNYQFGQGNYDAALHFYNLAVDRAAAAQQHNDNDNNNNDDDDDNEALQLNLCNRSACLFKMERYEEARDDAQRAVRLNHGKPSKNTDHHHNKALYRLAKTQLALRAYSEAMETVDAALEIFVDDASAATKGQKKAFQDLRREAQRLLEASLLPGQEEERLASIKTVRRGVSIREFVKGKELGVGNFSEIVMCRHKVTNEKFALKIIEKKQAADLAKRQHPNVYNEIQMERRTLLERLPPHENIVRMYHAFQDYNSIYYLMELHMEGGDLWSTIRYDKKMVGCHRSLAKVYLADLVDALEHLHTHGIVHRDLKPENVLITKEGHALLIDFGTAKDLIQTDLNGPEFVGTPDFMSPEAVRGTSGQSNKTLEAAGNDETGANHTADLWALGAVAFQLHTGQTPYWSPSPYLTFLKIKRGNLVRPWGVADEEAWNFISALMQVDPRKRLGADCFECDVSTSPPTMLKKKDGYNVLRNHPYFTKPKTNDSDYPLPSDSKQCTPVPSLRDLCVHACAELVRRDSLDVELCDRHPPGDGSSHDMLRLSERDRRCVMHLLDRQLLLREPIVYRRFFASALGYRLDKVRPDARDYVGLTRMNDNQGIFPTNLPDQDPYAKPVEMEPIRIVHISNPLLVKETNQSCDVEQYKQYKKLLKRCIASINKARPKVAVVSGFVDESCRKLLARINESIPVVVVDGSTFYSFWQSGVQGLALRSQDWLEAAESKKKDSEQLKWLREEMEQSRMSKHQVFAFVDCDPRLLPDSVTKRLARGKVLCLFGPSNDTAFDASVAYDSQDDNQSVLSTDSEEDEHDNHSMRVLGTHDNGLHCITIKDAQHWDLEFTPVTLK